MPGWNFARSPTTDDAFALASTSGTGVPGADAEPDGPLVSGAPLAAPLEGASPDPVAPESGAGPRRARPARTIATPMRRPTTPTPMTQDGMPALVPGVSRAVEVEASRRRPGSPSSSRPPRSRSSEAASTRDASASVAPHDRQKVRFDGLAIPHAGQRTRSASSSSSSSGQAGTGAGVGSGSPYGAPHDADASSGGAGSTGAGTAGVPGAPPAASAGCPSHSRNAPQEPQNWSPGMLLKPQRLQIVPGIVGHRGSLASDQEHEREVDHAPDDQEPGRPDGRVW